MMSLAHGRSTEFGARNAVQGKKKKRRRSEKKNTNMWRKQANK